MADAARRPTSVGVNDPVAISKQASKQAIGRRCSASSRLPTSDAPAPNAETPNARGLRFCRVAPAGERVRDDLWRAAYQPDAGPPSAGAASAPAAELSSEAMQV